MKLTVGELKNIIKEVLDEAAKAEEEKVDECELEQPWEKSLRKEEPKKTKGK